MTNENVYADPSKILVDTEGSYTDLFDCAYTKVRQKPFYIGDF